MNVEVEVLYEIHLIEVMRLNVVKANVEGLVNPVPDVIVLLTPLLHYV